MMRSRAEVAATARAMRDRNNNQPPMPGVYPDYPAPVVVVGEDGQREMRDMRWGMPTSKKVLLEAATRRADKLRAKGTEFDFAELLRMEPDKGVTNVRNTANASGGVNAHWRSGRPIDAWFRSPVSASRIRITSGRSSRSGSPWRTTSRWPSSPASGRPTPACGRSRPAGRSSKPSPS